MKNLFKLIFTLNILTFSLMGQEATVDQSTITYLDTLNAGKELIVTFEKAAEEPTPEPKATNNVTNKEAVKEVKEVKVTRSVIPNGFRIQILASSSVDAVREKKDELEEIILLPMYISFKSPYYKLLAGNFTDRKSAEKALVRIKDQGLTDAWIISSEVFKKD